MKIACCCVAVGLRLRKQKCLGKTYQLISHLEIYNAMNSLPLGKTRGIVIIMSVVCLWTFPCAQHNSTRSNPILVKLHRIVPWWIRKKPIDFVMMTSQ